MTAVRELTHALVLPCVLSLLLYRSAAVLFLSRELVTLAEALLRLMQAQIERAFHIQLPLDLQPSSQLYAVLLAMNTCEKVRRVHIND
jgi:hypothetical protein